MKVRFYIDPETGVPHIRLSAPGQTRTSVSAQTTKEASMTTKPTNYPPGWDESRVQRVLTHYESQTEEEAVAEDEAAFENPAETTMEVPSELVPKVRALIAKNKKSA